MAMFTQLKTGWPARVRYYDQNGERKSVSKMVSAPNQWLAIGRTQLTISTELGVILSNVK
ncbi:hypothetical protein [Lentilactobacillus parakefiri]|uniref:Uncharacterized protein n=1 Tax=Lentilactobacillus parakefiri TaxID=152332 RepID=A0A269XVD3_9LACO|nr:hypothetical protein [Lentilactobacillus parakefiri]PAK77220.1 hypothetical protein B8W98_11265 [Lentilactobacillus parakefiri]